MGRRENKKNNEKGSHCNKIHFTTDDNSKIAWSRTSPWILLIRHVKHLFKWIRIDLMRHEISEQIVLSCGILFDFISRIQRTLSDTFITILALVSFFAEASHYSYSIVFADRLGATTHVVVAFRCRTFLPFHPSRANWPGWLASYLTAYEI